MKTTHNQAIELAEKGNWNAAWKVAQQDEGFDPKVTKYDWIRFATKCIARRKAEAKVNAEWIDF